MKSTEEVATPFLAAVAEWQQTGKPLVIAIEGYPGISKTTLAKHLGARKNVRTLHQDDYLFPLKQRLTVFDEGVDRTKMVIHGFRDDKRLMEDVERFRQEAVDGDILIVEGIFLLDPERCKSGTWNKSVYVAGDFDQADARRIEREKRRWGDDYFSPSHPHSLFALLTKTYRQWAEEVQPEAKADLVIRV